MASHKYRLILATAVAAALMVAFIIAVTLPHTSSNGYGTAATHTTAGASSRSRGGNATPVKAWVAREMEVVGREAWLLSGPTYASLGYPEIHLPADGINVSYGMLIKERFLRVGYVHVDVLNLTRAWSECVKALKSSLGRLLPNATKAQLSHVGFSLVSADFLVGRVANDTLDRRPAWDFTVALTWDGVRLSPVNGGDLMVEVDALKGNVSIDLAGVPRYVLPPPNLTVTVPKAVRVEGVIKVVEEALARFVSHSSPTRSWAVSYAREALHLLRRGCLARPPELLLARLGGGGSLSMTSLGSHVLDRRFEGVWMPYWLVEVGGNYSTGVYEVLISVEGGSLVAISYSPIYPPAPYFLGLSINASPAGMGVNATVVRELVMGGRTVKALVTLEDAVNLSRSWAININILVRTYPEATVTIRRNESVELVIKPVWPPSLNASVRPASAVLKWWSGEGVSVEVSGGPAGREAVNALHRVPAVIIRVTCRWGTGSAATYYSAVPAVP